MKSPSFHSRVVESSVPYSASFDIAFGSITYDTPSTPLSRSSAVNNTLHAAVFPVAEGPTIMSPCWIFWIW